MNCREIQDLIPLYASGGAEPDEQRAVRAHLNAGCPQCHAALAEMQAMLNQLPLSLDPTLPPSAAKKRLMDRVDRAIRPGEAPITQSPTRANPFAGILIRTTAAAILVIVVTIAVSRTQSAKIESLQSALKQRDASIPVQEAELRKLQQQVTNTIQFVELLKSPDVRSVDLKGAGDQPKATARVFWNQKSQCWHVYAFGLQPLTSSQTYELWFFNSANKPVRAGIFNVDSQGAAGVKVPVPSNFGAISLAAVTVEPAGGTDQPSSPPMLVSSKLN